jgi:hypothetical protein
MLEWIVLSAVKLLKIAIVGIVSLASSCEDRPAVAPASAGGGAPTTGSVVLMRELGCVELSTEEAVARPELRAGVEVVTVILHATEAAALAETALAEAGEA